MRRFFIDQRQYDQPDNAEEHAAEKLYRKILNVGKREGVISADAVDRQCGDDHGVKGAHPTGGRKYDPESPEDKHHEAGHHAQVGGGLKRHKAEEHHEVVHQPDQDGVKDHQPGFFDAFEAAEAIAETFYEVLDFLIEAPAFDDAAEPVEEEEAEEKEGDQDIDPAFGKDGVAEFFFKKIKQDGALKDEGQDDGKEEAGQVEDAVDDDGAHDFFGADGFVSGEEAGADDFADAGEAHIGKIADHDRKKGIGHSALHAHGADEHEPAVGADQVADQKGDDDGQDPPVIDAGKVGLEFLQQATFGIGDAFEGAVGDIGGILAAVDQDEDQGSDTGKEDELDEFPYAFG